jgi:plastocyanin
MVRRVSVGIAAGLLTLTLVSGLAFVLPAAGASSGTVVVQIPAGANAGPTATNPFGFTPANVTVVVGVNNTIVWTNNDTVYHTVYFLSSKVPSGYTAVNSTLIAAGATYGPLTFTVPGTYHYYCNLHPYMMGTITVLAGTSPVPEFPAAYLALTLFAVIGAVVLVAPRMRPPGPAVT